MGTWLVGAAVLAIIGLTVYGMYKDRKKGKGCGCGCDGCPGNPRNGSASVQSEKNPCHFPDNRLY